MVNAASFEAAMADAAQRNTSTTNTEEGNVLASAAPLIALRARAGWAATAGQDVQLSAADNKSPPKAKSPFRAKPPTSTGRPPRRSTCKPPAVRAS